MTNRRRWSTLHFTMRMLHYLESFCMMSQKKPLYWSLQAFGKIGGLYFSLQVLLLLVVAYGWAWKFDSESNDVESLARLHFTQIHFEQVFAVKDESSVMKHERVFPQTVLALKGSWRSKIRYP